MKLKIPQHLRGKLGKRVKDTLNTASYNARVLGQEVKGRISAATQRAISATSKVANKQVDRIKPRGSDPDTRKFYGGSRELDGSFRPGKPRYYDKHYASHQEDLKTPVKEETIKAARKTGVRKPAHEIPAKRVMEHKETKPQYRAGLGWGRISTRVSTPKTIPSKKVKASTSYPSVYVDGKPMSIVEAVKNAPNDLEGNRLLKPIQEKIKKQKEARDILNAKNLQAEANKLKDKRGESVSEKIAKKVNVDAQKSDRTLDKGEAALQGKGEVKSLNKSQKARVKAQVFKDNPKWLQLTQNRTLPIYKVFNKKQINAYNAAIKEGEAKMIAELNKSGGEPGKMAEAIASGTAPKKVQRLNRRIQSRRIRRVVEGLEGEALEKWLDAQGKGAELGSPKKNNFAGIAIALKKMNVEQLERWLAKQTEVSGSDFTEQSDALLERAAAILSKKKGVNIRNRPKTTVSNAAKAHKRADDVYDKLNEEQQKIKPGFKGGVKKQAGPVVNDDDPNNPFPNSDRQVGQSKNRRNIENSTIHERMIELDAKLDRLNGKEEKDYGPRRMAVGGLIGAGLGLKSGSNYIARVKGEHKANQGWAGHGVPENSITKDRPKVYPTLKDFPGMDEAAQTAAEAAAGKIKAQGGDEWSQGRAARAAAEKVRAQHKTGRRVNAWAKGEVPLFSKHAPKGFRGHVAKNTLKRVGRLTAAGVIAGGLYDAVKRRRKRREENQED